MIVDAHQHFWSLARGDNRWLTPDLTPLYRDFGPGDLAPNLSAHSIDGTVLVQAADTVAETLWMLERGTRAGFVRAVVGWVDFEEPDTARFDIDRLAGEPLFRGVRPMIQDIADPDWMLRPSHGDVLLELVRRGLTFDALVTPVHLAPLLEFATRYPGLSIIIDHGAKPVVAKGEHAAWAQGMGLLGAQDNTVVKVSGLVTEADTAFDWGDPERGAQLLRPYFDTLLQAFGPERMMWGSDWPVVGCAASYGEWFAVTEALLAPLTALERAAIMGGTATQVYSIPT